MLTAFLLSIFNILPSEERKLCYCIGRIDGEESKSAASHGFLLLFVI